MTVVSVIWIKRVKVICVDFNFGYNKFYNSEYVYYLFIDS